MAVTYHLRITGRVQGVGFRDALRTEAITRRLVGWVRNRRDGSVEAVVQGEPAQIDSLIGWARIGPPTARVHEVLARPASGELEREYRGFDWRPTA
jgi:acylphosphatase